MKQQEKKLSTKKGEISSKLVVEKTIKERARELLKKLEVHYKVKDKVHYRDLVGDKNLTLITKALKQTEERVIGEIEKEARKIFIDMRDNPDCVYVDFKGDDKRYKGEEGIALESFREGIFDYFKRLDDSINKLKKK